MAFGGVLMVSGAPFKLMSAPIREPDFRILPQTLLRISDSRGNGKVGKKQKNGLQLAGVLGFPLSFVFRVNRGRARSTYESFHSCFGDSVS
jgi:hypothetical protein